MNLTTTPWAGSFFVRNILGVFMAYYLIIDAEILDHDKYARYVVAVTSVVEKFGGRYLVRGGEVEPFAGDYDGSRQVVIEFESKYQARAFWDSSEYAATKTLREGASRGSALGVEGV